MKYFQTSSIIPTNDQLGTRSHDGRVGKPHVYHLQEADPESLCAGGSHPSVDS